MTALVIRIRRGDGVEVTVRGQTARSLLALIKAGPRGVTAAEVATWAFRFAAYCFELRKLGLVIETLREPHPGGWHGRHVLRSAVVIAETGEAA